MSLDVAYRSLDHITRDNPPRWRETLLEQTTGYYLAMSLLPAIFWVVRRWPFRLTFSRIGIHGLAVAVYAIAHTSLMWESRAILSPLLGLGRYDYGAMPVRYLMEFPRQ